MGHIRKRPITGTTEAGVVQPTYIVVEAGYHDDLNIQCIANGTVTFQVATTLQNIMYDTAAQAAVNIGGGNAGNPNDRFVDPASAIWTEIIASGSATADFQLVNEPIFAVRIDQTAGTGSVTFTIIQS